MSRPTPECCNLSSSLWSVHALARGDVYLGAMSRRKIATLLLGEIQFIERLGVNLLHPLS